MSKSTAPTTTAAAAVSASNAGGNKAKGNDVSTSVTTWDCQTWLCPETAGKRAIVILNQPLNCRQRDFIDRLWSACRVRVAVDGGCNRLLEVMPQLTPDLITGDLDSVRTDVLDMYRDRGAEVVCTPDQNFTDFTKCLQVLAERQPSLETVLVFCAPGGRLDQLMANLNTLYKSDSIMRATVALLSGEDLTWVLRKGRHRILTPRGFRGDYCGLVPLGSPATVTSQGLKWDLKSSLMEFRGLISTSNRFLENSVSVETTGDILWTMTMNV